MSSEGPDAKAERLLALGRLAEVQRHQVAAVQATGEAVRRLVRAASAAGDSRAEIAAAMGVSTARVTQLRRRPRER